MKLYDQKERQEIILMIIKQRIIFLKIGEETDLH